MIWVHGLSVFTTAFACMVCVFRNWSVDISACFFSFAFNFAAMQKATEVDTDSSEMESPESESSSEKRTTMKRPVMKRAMKDAAVSAAPKPLKKAMKAGTKGDEEGNEVRALTRPVVGSTSQRHGCGSVSNVSDL